MNWRSYSKRFLVMLLVLSMLVGLVPMGVIKAEAASDTIYVLAGGDFQEAGDHVNSAENVTNILAQVSQKYTTMDGFLFIGDYDCETHNDATETANGITALMGAVQGSYSNLNDANSVLVQGNHDYMDSRIDATGGHDFDGYAAYVLNEDDYPNGGGSQSGIQTLANNLKTWLSNKIGEGYDAPIFIVSHLPLAFGPRTQSQGDGMYAKYIFDVLNDAGENGLNIIFLHGHDHAYGYDNYLGGEAIYLKKGDSIFIAEAGSKTAYTTETLNFTYMNAGYTGYYSEGTTATDGTDKLTMTVFAITGSQVTVERYSADGLYNLKSAGRTDGSHGMTVPAVNGTTYTSPQTIALTEAEDYGTIGSWVGVEAETPADDVTTAGGSWVEITAPVPGTPEVPSTTTYQYTLDTDGVNNDVPYLIVGSGAAKAMGNGTLTAVDTTLSEDETKVVLDAQADYEWTITTDGKITNGTQYLVFTGNTDSSNGTLSTTTDASAATAWTIRDNGNGNYSIYVSHTFTTTDQCNNEQNNNEFCFLYYNNNAFTIGTTGTESDTSYTVCLYGAGQEVTTEYVPAVPDTNGTYGKVVGDLTYNATIGMTADEAMALVKAGIDGYYVDAMSTPGSDVTGTILDDGALTWTLDPNYNGNTAGDYAVTIAYNGVTVGTAEVVVPATTTYYVAEGNGLYLVDMNTSADNALAAVKAGVTVYSATDANGTNKTAIDDSLVTWNWVDTYNGADSGPYTVEVLKDGTSLGTVEVKVNVKYETGIADGWTETGTTGDQYTYVLDTNGIDYGSDNKYLIVGYYSDGTSDDFALTANGSSTGAVDVEIDGSTATVNTRSYEWYFATGLTSTGSSTYNTFITQNGTTWLYHTNGYMYVNNGSDAHRGYWRVNADSQANGLYKFDDQDGSNWYLRYSASNGRFTVRTDTNTYVRLYKYDSMIPGSTIYAKIEGNTVYTVDQGTSATSAMAAVKAGITGYLSSNADGSDATELTDNQLTWKWKNTYSSMITGSYWVEISYNGVVLGTVEVKVEPGVVNNYPEYPDEGAVKVSKTATGVDFQSSGIAQVEVSASGVPIKKGADVIIMLDTSSSMAYCLDCNDTRHDSYVCDRGGQTRAQALEATLADLLAQFKTPGDDGQVLDIDVAIADFNGFNGYGGTSGTPYDRDENDNMSDDVKYTANGNNALIYTGDNTLGAGAFVAAEDLAASYTLNYDSGTNYDYAFDAIYQMATAKQAANGSEERDLYVIFMTDGAAMQWNYYHSQGNSSLWNSWITGAWSAADLTATNLNCTTHAYYYDEVDHDGDGQINEHRMANAIKGDPSETFEVIRKTSDLGTATGEDNMYMVPGLGAKLFSIAFDPRVDTNVTVESLLKSVASLASDQTGTTQYFYNVSSADELANAFTAIGAEIAYAASNARFVDQMGDNYNLQLKPFVDYNGDAIDADGDGTQDTPTIEIISYDIYTRQDYLNGTITEDKIGDRKGTYTILETVTFNADGTEAYSDQIDGGATNILADGTQAGYVKGVIYAKTFLYNTNATEVAVEGVSIPTGTNSDGTTTGSTNVLPSETFYWKLGTVQTSELAMRYYVYLEGSMEGTREGGSYPTNEYATLYYDNYLENPCHKETVSPVMAWEAANVSYAFYLVDEDGNIIVNQTTGETGSFANKIAVTNPVVYEEILLNNIDEVSSINVQSLGVLPTGYDLYDTSAVYTIRINSDATGSWEITKGSDKVASTYVTQYNPQDSSAYSNDLLNGVDENGNTVVTGHDYTHTVVWFAVLWKVQALPDTVVIDYGLPVDISVLTNDMFGENGKLAGVGAADAEGVTLDGYTADNKLPSNSYTGTYGTATADIATGKVRYTLNTSNGMQMQTYEKFAYAVNYTGTTNPGYYYDTVTVIPATTIYYEDSFVTTKSYTWNNDTNGWVESNQSLWSREGIVDSDATQAEDRPGQYSLTDANNIYGYDGVNLNLSTYSLDSALKATVDYDNYAEASFTFWGTGFDIISMTSNMTGAILVDVERLDATQDKGTYAVDTYYGYKQEAGDADGDGTVEDGEVIWVVDPDASGSLWQVPVIKVVDLPYGQYTVTIKATYDPAFDHVEASYEGEYDFYLDAIRIYDPANDGAADDSEDTTIEDAYVADGEGWPSYFELRNNLITAETLGNAEETTTITGEVFIDGDSTVGDAQIKDYESFGPNNEVYLAPGQSIAFLLSDVLDAEGKSIVDNIHIGIKSANGETVTYSISNIAEASNSETGVEAGDRYGEKTGTISSTTDMYYDLTGWRNDIIVITNTGDPNNTTGIISLTNIKTTYTKNPNGNETAGVMTLSLEDETTVQTETVTNEVYAYMTPAAATLTLRSLNTPAVEETPDVTEPEVTEPEETEPETTEPEETEPETTVPEETEPETTVPEETEPEEEPTTEEVIETIVKEIIKVIGGWFGKWF